MKGSELQRGRDCLRRNMHGTARLMAAIGVALAVVPLRASATDTSAPAMLEMFEASWSTLQNRMPDIFQAGYGQMWLPPPERADTGKSF